MPGTGQNGRAHTRRRSLVYELTIRFVLLVTLTTALVLAGGGWLLQRQGNQALVMMRQLEADELAGLINTGEPLTPEQLRARIQNHTDRDYALYFIQISNGRGEVVFKSANLGDAFVTKPADAKETWLCDIPGAGSSGVLEKQAGPWRIRVASPLWPAQHILNEYMGVAAVLGVLAIAVSVLSGYAFSRMTVSPVRAIERTARRIRADNLSERIVVPKAHGEFAALADLLNQAFDRIEKAFAQVRRFTADASHELKTPLALVRLNGEKLSRRIAGDAEAGAVLADLIEEADHMQRIIDSLLFIAKAEGGGLAIQRKFQDMHPLISDFADDAQALAEDRGTRFALIRSDEGGALVDEIGLRQILLNLASNAIAASPRGGLITLSSERTDKGWRIVMCDEGPGLPAEMLERVFERFTRHQPPASSAGSGLGLAICRSIAGLHGGAIRAENRTDRGGLRIVFEW